MGQVAQQVLVGMQTSPAMHACCPVGHESPQAVEPPTVLQVWFGPHTVPQAPQLLLSFVRFAQYGAPASSSLASTSGGLESPPDVAPSPEPPAASPELPPPSGMGPASGG